jgi:hypothetical protein
LLARLLELSKLSTGLPEAFAAAAMTSAEINVHVKTEIKDL